MCKGKSKGCDSFIMHKNHCHNVQDKAKTFFLYSIIVLYSQIFIVYNLNYTLKSNYYNCVIGRLIISTDVYDATKCIRLCSDAFYSHHCHF